ncbi:MAG: tripartite tricarboxylate transporter TctB family protein [Betaproteobacteria bacterium]
MNTSDVSDQNNDELSDISSVSPLSDFVFSLFWIALGSLIMLASWQMDRLERQGSTLYTAPGSYPGLLGSVLLILGVLLAARSYKAGGHRLERMDFHFSKIHLTSFLRVGVFLVFVLVYCVGLIGRSGIPFWVATFLFVTTFIILFNWQAISSEGFVKKVLVLAISMGVGTSFVVSYVFQELFLVRLP